MGLKRNILSGSILAVGNALIILISYPFFLKYLGMELYGLWATLSVVVNFASIGRLGIDTAIIKYIAEEYGKDNKEGIEKYFSTAVIVLSIGGILIFLVLFPLKGFLINIISVPDVYISLANALLPCMIILSVSIFLVRVTNGALRGLGRVDIANYLDLGGRAISIVTSLIFLKLGYGIWSLFWGQVLFYVLLGFSSFYIAYRQLGSIFFSVKSFDSKYLRKMIGFGGTMTAAQLISMLLVPFNKIVIARYISLSGVTYFEIADRAVSQIRSIFVMGISAMMPEVSRLSASENAQRKIDNILKKTLGLAFYLGIPVFIVFFFSGHFFLQLWLSDRYVPDIAIAFKIILVGYAINLLSVPIYYMFMGIGKVGYCFINHIVQAILNAVFIVVSIFTHNVGFYLLIGIYSSSIALSAILLIIMFAAYRKINFMEIHDIFRGRIKTS